MRSLTASSSAREAVVSDERVDDKKIKIGFTRTCGCPPNHINCLTAKEWVRGQVAIWEFYYEKRDIRDKNIHPAVFPISLPRRCIELFTHPGELVIDPFAGIGSTLLAAQDTGRNAVGFDLNEEYVAFARGRLERNSSLDLYEAKQLVMNTDAINIPDYLNEKTVSLVVTSPPYANMLNHRRLNKSLRSDLRKNEHFKKVQQYSDNPRDLGTMDIRKYVQALVEIYELIIPLLKPKAHCVINVNDLWENNHRYPTHSYIIEAMEAVGYELRNIVIWDKRKLVNRVGIYGYPSNYITFSTTFEYIIDFWKKP